MQLYIYIYIYIYGPLYVLKRIRRQQTRIPKHVPSLLWIIAGRGNAEEKFLWYNHPTNTISMRKRDSAVCHYWKITTILWHTDVFIIIYWFIVASLYKPFTYLIFCLFAIILFTFFCFSFFLFIFHTQTYCHCIVFHTVNI